MLLVLALTMSLSCSGLGCGALAGSAPAELVGGSPQLDEVALPGGFRIHVYAADVEGARSMTPGPEGVLFVGSRDPGTVYAVIDRNDDKQADEVRVLASELSSPNGVAWKDGSLYVAEISRILRFDGVEQWLKGGGAEPPPLNVVLDTLPDEESHGWKFIAFGPDGLLYVPVGAPCNICESSDERFASILRMKPDGSGLEIYAKGVRNTVGFDWQPETNVLWFTDNGRDRMGDDVPPDELNRAAQAGLHFGFPYCHGKDVPDPEHKKLGCSETEPPRAELSPHTAALGMRFYTGASFPEPWRKGVFIAEHGSWNRSDPIGYRVTFVSIDGDRAGAPRNFATGFLKDGIAWGRPVDVEVLEDGSLLVSDDKADAIYRIHHLGDGTP